MHHPVFQKFERFKGLGKPEFHVNFLGVVTRRDFFLGGPQVNDNTTVVDAPYPAFDDQYFEWINLLESVVAADKEFTMIELGAGYGHWLVNAALAVKRYHKNLPFKLIGVEAEPTHFQWMKQHFQDNGIDPEQHELIEAAVSDKDGEVCFYVGNPDEWYGQSIVPEVDPDPVPFEKVQAISLNTILSQLDRVDLIDLDVQGAELVVLSSAIKELNKKVKRIFVGTHHHEIEKGLRDLFRKHEWYKVNDYTRESCKITEWGEISFGDGVQTWINPRLSPIRTTQEELERLQSTITRLANSQYQLHKELARSHTQLQHTQSELNQLRGLVSNMENTKFWKLRTAWLRLKQTVGLTRGE